MRERMPSIFSWYPIWVILWDTMIPSVKAHVNMHPATLKYKITQSHIMIILQLLISLQTQQIYQQPHVLMSTS